MNVCMKRWLRLLAVELISGHWNLKECFLTATRLTTIKTLAVLVLPRMWQRSSQSHWESMNEHISLGLALLRTEVYMTQPLRVFSASLDDLLPCDSWKRGHSVHHTAAWNANNSNRCKCPPVNYRLVYSNTPSNNGDNSTIASSFT